MGIPQGCYEPGLVVHRQALKIGEVREGSKSVHAEVLLDLVEALRWQLQLAQYTLADKSA